MQLLINMNYMWVNGLIIEKAWTTTLNNFVCIFASFAFVYIYIGLDMSLYRKLKPLKRVSN